MRILMLNNEFPPLGGGMGTVNRELLKQLSGQSQYEIDLVTSSPDHRLMEDRLGEKIWIYRLPVHVENPHHATNPELIRYAVRAFRYAAQLHRSKPYDLCFAWSGVPAGGVAYLLSRLHQLPYLVRVCGPDIPGFERRYAGLYPLLTPFIRSIWQRAQLIIAKCQEEVDMIGDIDDRVRTLIIQNGVSLETFGSTPRKSYEGPLRLLCVGRLIERKGQSHLIEVARRMKQKGIPVVLDFVGTGDAFETYRDEVTRAGLENEVTFQGYIPHEDIGAHYQAAEVFILPSYNEGMSIATLEAMAAGLPVIVTKTGGSTELVKEGVNGHIYDWGDLDRLENLLIGLSGNHDKLSSMGDSSRERAALFSWAKAASQYIDLFEEINASNISRENVEKVMVP